MKYEQILKEMYPLSKKQEKFLEKMYDDLCIKCPHRNIILLNLLSDIIWNREYNDEQQYVLRTITDLYRLNRNIRGTQEFYNLISRTLKYEI